MNEAETRAEHIDPALAAVGWGVVDESRIRREYPITLGRIESRGRRGRALKANYLLEYRNTNLAKETRRLANIYERKKSLLHQAFSGQLTGGHARAEVAG